jgi:Protein of unknown function (DUF2849)
MTQFAITANLVREGTVVYLHEDAAGFRAWPADLAAATLYETKAAAEIALARAEVDVTATLVVGTYHFEVEIEGGKPVPVTARERIRAAHNPTIEYGR